MAAVEFVLWFAFISTGVFNAADLGLYVYKDMQVEMAAQAAVQAAWHSCNSASTLPLTVCATSTGTNVLGAMQAAAQSTSLGTAVSMPAGSVVEGYYCSNGAGQLSLLGTAGSTSTKPTYSGTCSSITTGDTAAPGDYVQASATYTFTPLFTTASITSLLPSTITRQASLRLD